MRRTCATLCLLALLLVACSGDDSADDPPGVTPDDTATDEDEEQAADQVVLVFNGEGNNLNVYTGDPPFTHQQLITNVADDPESGLDINAQICFFDDGERFISGEDTGQPDPPAAWGIFELDGDEIGSLEATQVARLTPTYQDDNPENYGCGLLSDGRIVTTDIGEQVSGEGTGQLIVWFPPFEGGLDGEVGAIPYCKLDVGIPTALGIAVDDDDNVYVASARTSPSVTENGVWRYSGPFPTDDTPDGGCDSTDATGAPMASEVTKELFIPAGEDGLSTPSSVVITDDGELLVASVFTGVINRYDADGQFVETILSPPEGEVLGAEPYSTGTPQGIGIGPDGTVYYADIGIVVSEAGVGPGQGTGTVRRITFVDGEPQPPETMAEGLAFPDGIGVLVLDE